MRRPRGYVGLQHETLGSDILSVVEALKLPDQILGAEQAQRLRGLDPKGWYPIGPFLELLEELNRQIGRFGMLKVGRTLFRLSHEAKVKQVAKTVRDLLYSMDAMYHHANRGQQIGGWKVLSFEPGRAELEKTTPHLCLMEEGILAAAFNAIGARASVEQSSCFRDGADCCKFVVSTANPGPTWGPSAGQATG